MNILNAANIPLNANSGTVPDVSGALIDWFQPMVFTTVKKEVVGFQAVEKPTNYSFQGVWQPFTARQLMLKPEGQRAWSWFSLHAEPALVLEVDDVINYLGTQYRVMSKKDYSLYGYVEYSLVEDWKGAGLNP